MTKIQRYVSRGMTPLGVRTSADQSLSIQLMGILVKSLRCGVASCPELEKKHLRSMEQRCRFHFNVDANSNFIGLCLISKSRWGKIFD